MKSKYELAEEYADRNFEHCLYTDTSDKTLTDFDKILETYIEGYETKEKQIIDKINGLKSKLAEEKVKKLTKIINQERVKELEAQIKILQEICG